MTNVIHAIWVTRAARHDKAEKFIPRGGDDGRGELHCQPRACNATCGAASQRSGESVIASNERVGGATVEPLN